jgi:dihydrolipoamide dehydrogenase
MANSDIHVAVLGAGPGGYAAAFRAADLGMQVSLIDREVNPGGVCLYRGCIPSKALLHVAKLINEAEEASEWGIDFGKPKIDRERLKSFKERVVAKLTGGLGQLTKTRKINYLKGNGAFVDSTTLAVTDDDGKTTNHSFDYIILASGSSPTVIPFLNLDTPRIMDSTDALELEDIPETLLVVGGGYIGLELGSVYAALGTKVTVVEMTDGLLPGGDRDLVKVLHGTLKKHLHEIKLKTKVAAVKELKNGIKVTLEDENGESSFQTFDRVLVSVGRTPNSKNLGLENTKVEIIERGFVRVDHQLKTDDPNIYAIGDICGEPMLAHKANAEAHVAVEAIAGEKVAFEPNCIPAVVFTDPELAWAGITEQQAKAAGRSVKIGKFPWAASGRAVTIDRSDGLTKIITDPETGRVLGVGIVGPGAGEMIAEGALAIEMAALAKDVKLTIHPHPTLSETIMESAELIYGASTHMYKK